MTKLRTDGDSTSGVGAAGTGEGVVIAVDISGSVEIGAWASIG